MAAASGLNSIHSATTAAKFSSKKIIGIEIFNTFTPTNYNSITLNLIL
jgi:hypothetical protein